MDEDAVLNVVADAASESERHNRVRDEPGPRGRVARRATSCSRWAGIQIFREHRQVAPMSFTPRSNAPVRICSAERQGGVVN